MLLGTYCPAIQDTLQSAFAEILPVQWWRSWKKWQLTRRRSHSWGWSFCWNGPQGNQRWAPQPWNCRWKLQREKRKEIINKHQAKNMKTNFLQAKSSREQFHVIRCSAALAYKVRRSDRLSEVSVFLINQLSHSQRNFRHWSCAKSENTRPSPSAVSTESRDWQNQGRINEELLHKHPWEGEVKAERNFKQKAKHGLLVGPCSRNQRETGHKNWNSFIHPTSILRQSWGSKEKVFTARLIVLAPAL